MKRFVLAVALTGLMSITVLAGEVPINGAAATPTPTPTTATTNTNTSTSTVIANVVLMIITLIGR
jgi:hypothetical protein